MESKSQVLEVGAIVRALTGRLRGSLEGREGGPLVWTAWSEDPLGA